MTLPTSPACSPGWDARRETNANTRAKKARASHYDRLLENTNGQISIYGNDA
jgi:hypothetical protein